MDRRLETSVCWLLAALPAAALGIALFLIAPNISPKPDFARAQDLFLEVMLPLCLPEPLEHTRYLLAIIIVPAVYLIAIQLCRRWTVKQQEPVARVTLVGAIVMQVCLIVFAAWNLRAHVRQMLSLFGAGLACLMVLGLAAIVWRRIRRRIVEGGRAEWLRSARVPYLIGLGYGCLWLLPSIVRDVTKAHDGVTTHMAYTMGEFSAILNGRTMLVDFFPQYQTLTPYLLLPVFRITLLSELTFTVVMTILSIVMLLLVLRVLHLYTGSAWSSLLLWIPLVSVSAHPYTDVLKGGYMLTPFSYFAIGPLRYFGPFLTAFLCARYLADPRARRLALLSIVAGLSVLNNLDFGFPAFVAAFAAVLTVESRYLIPSRAGAVRTLVYFGVSLAACVAGFSLFTLLRSGSFPDWRQFGGFQRIYALYGFGMLPMPPAGPQWLLYLTFMSVLLLAIARSVRPWAGSPASAELRLRQGMLVFSGVFGSGAMMYYVGRSHPYTLQCIFPAWTFSLTLLVWEQVRHWHRSRAFRSATSSTVHVLPTVLLLSFYITGLGCSLRVPSPGEQWQRIRSAGNTLTMDRQLAADYIRSRAPTGERIGVIYPFGYEIANSAQASNVFPFTCNWSMNLKSQLETALRLFRQGHVRHLFIDRTPNSEQVNSALEAEGYRVESEFDPGIYSHIYHNPDWAGRYPMVHWVKSESPFGVWLTIFPSSSDPRRRRPYAFVREVQVSVTRHGAGDGVARFTTDGTLPTSRSEVIEHPIRLTKSTTLKARAFIDDAAVGPVLEAQFERWDEEGAAVTDVKRGGDPAERIRIAVQAGGRVALVVNDANDGIDYDEGDWADAAFECSSGRVYLSQLQAESAKQDWGSLVNDRSLLNKPIQIGGLVYEHGLAVSANAELVYSVPHGCKEFVTWVGVDDAAEKKGSVRFIVRPIARAADARADSQPRLLLTRGSYSVVAFRGLIYGVPQSLGAVNWAGGLVARLPGVTTGVSVDEVISRLPPDPTIDPQPRLLRSHQGYNLIGYRGRIYGIPQSSGPVNWEGGQVARLPGVVTGGTVEEVLARLPR